jgi:hypothetical protein
MDNSPWPVKKPGSSRQPNVPGPWFALYVLVS